MKASALPLSLILILVPLAGCLEMPEEDGKYVGYDCFEDVYVDNPILFAPGMRLVNGIDFTHDSNVITWNLLDENGYSIDAPIAYFFLDNDSVSEVSHSNLMDWFFPVSEACEEFGNEVFTREGCDRVLYIDESLWYLDEVAILASNLHIYTKTPGKVASSTLVFCAAHEYVTELEVSTSVGNASIGMYSSDATQEFYVSLEDGEVIITRAEFF